jgi:hypothetical protein
MFGGTSLATLDLADRFGSDTYTLREILLGQIELTAMLTDTLAEEHIILHWVNLTWPSGHICTGLCPFHCTYLSFFCGQSCDVIAQSRTTRQRKGNTENDYFSKSAAYHIYDEWKRDWETSNCLHSLAVH